MRRLILGLVGLLLVGVSDARTAAHFGFGQPPTYGEAQELVKKHILSQLQDTASVRDVVIGLPVAGCYERGFGAGRDICGYRICVSYEAKDIAGNYSGRTVRTLWRAQGFGVSAEQSDSACVQNVAAWDGSVEVELPRFCDRQPKHADCRYGRTEYYPPSETEAAIHFTGLSGLCLGPFPDATDMKDDGDKRLSSKGYVNVALVEGGIEYVCSVNLRDRTISRIWVDGQSHGYDGFQIAKAGIVAAEARRNAARLDGFTYKGMSIGERVRSIEKYLPAYRPSKYSERFYDFDSDYCYKEFPRDAKARVACNESASFGGTSVKKGLLYVGDSIVKEIDLTIDPLEIPKLKLAVSTRYGRPKVDEAPVFQNGFGAKFQGVYVEWEYKDTYLAISSTGKDFATVKVRALSDKKASSEMAKEAAERASKDF